MKIWYVNPYAGGPGVGRYWRAYHLAKEWGRVGHEVTVVTASYHHLMDRKISRKGTLDVDSVRFKFLKTNKYQGNGIGRMTSMLTFSCVLFFWGILQGIRAKPDVIIYSSAHPFGYISAWLISKITRARLIFEVRDLWPLGLIEIAGFKNNHPIVRVLSFIEKFAYRKSYKVVSLLPGAKDHMIKRGMASEKFSYVSNGFSHKENNINVQDISSPLVDKVIELKKAGKFVFFYAGAFGEPNAMHKFVDALEIFDQVRPVNVEFVLVGKGEQFNEIQERCNKIAPQYVHFYGQVDKAVIDSVMANVDAGFFVMHDLPIYRFGISLNKLFDYMSASLPIVGAYKPFNDIISDAGCGIMVQPDQPRALSDAFLSMSQEPLAQREKLGVNGRLYLERNFDYSVLAARMLAAQSNDLP